LALSWNPIFQLQISYRPLGHSL